MIQDVLLFFLIHIVVVLSILDGLESLSPYLPLPMCLATFKNNNKDTSS